MAMVNGFPFYVPSLFPTSTSLFHLLLITHRPRNVPQTCQSRSAHKHRLKRASQRLTLCKQDPQSKGRELI